MGAPGERSGCRPHGRGLIAAGIFLLATLQEVAGQDTCLRGAIKVCRVLRVPELELQIIPQGVVELKGFEGTCSIECINYLQNSAACKKEPATQREIGATCRALTCWSNVASACGTEINDQSCSQDCALALNATVCRGTEKVFPEYSDYLANFGPTSNQCVTLQCTRNYLGRECRKFDSQALSMPSSSLCDPRCYRSLFRETCSDAAISIIGLNGLALPWEEKAFEDTRFGPLSSLCANYTHIRFSVVLEDSSMEDISRDGQPERFAEDIQDSLGSVLLLLGVTSAPELEVSNLRPASVLDPSDGIAADVAAVFTNDPGGAELFELVLQANPGLLFGEYGGVNVPERSVNVEEAFGDDAAKEMLGPPMLKGPPQPTCGGDPYASFAKWQLQQVEGKWPKAACKQVCDQAEDCLSSVFNPAVFQTCKLFSSCEVAVGPAGDSLVFKDGTVPELPVAGPNDPRPVCGGEPFRFYTGWQLKQTGKWVKSACIEKCAKNSKCMASVFNDLAFKKCKLYESCTQVAGSPDDILVFKHFPGVPPPPLAIFIPPPLPPASPTQPMPVCGGAPYAFYGTWKLEKYPGWPKLTCQKLCQDDGRCVASVHNAEVYQRCKLFDTCNQAPGSPDDELVFKSIPGVAPPPLMFFTAEPTPSPRSALTLAPSSPATPTPAATPSSPATPTPALTPAATSSALTPVPTPTPAPTTAMAPTSSTAAALTPTPTPTSTPTSTPAATSSPTVAPTPLVTPATTPAPTLVPTSTPTAATTLTPTPTATPMPTTSPTSTVPATLSPITTPVPNPESETPTLPTLPVVTEAPIAPAEPTSSPGESETPSQTLPADPDATPVSPSPDESSTVAPAATTLVPSPEDSSSTPASASGQDADSNTRDVDQGAGSPTQSPDASVVVVGGSERSIDQAAEGRSAGADTATEEGTEASRSVKAGERGMSLQEGSISGEDSGSGEFNGRPVAIGVGVAAGSAAVIAAAALIAAKAKVAGGAAAAAGGAAAAAPPPAGAAVDAQEPELPTRLATDMDAVDGGGITLTV